MKGKPNNESLGEREFAVKAGGVCAKLCASSFNPDLVFYG